MFAGANFVQLIYAKDRMLNFCIEDDVTMIIMT